MKFNQAKIKKIVQSVFRGGKSYGEHIMMHPVREWYTGVLVASILIIGGAIYATATFMRHQNVSLYEAQVTASSTVYREATVKAALAEVSRKQTQYAVLEQRLRDNNPGIVRTVGQTATATTTQGVSDAEASGQVDEVQATTSDASVVSPPPQEEAASEVIGVPGMSL